MIAKNNNLIRLNRNVLQYLATNGNTVSNDLRWFEKMVLQYLIHFLFSFVPLI